MGKRTPKLPVASAERRKVAISEDDWKRIEKAYGKKLSPEARKDIHEKTQKFVDRAEFEQNAEPVSDARDLITSIIETANALRSALQRGDRDAHVHARTLIKKHLRKEAIKKRGLETLDGGAGALNGVAENNTYVGDNAGGVMAENANEGIDADDLLRAISSDMGQLIFASQDALRELNDTKDEGLKEGEAWDRWVNELGAIAKARGLPAGVR
jgi:hypothetical protein